jgi:hypothetical protein
MMECEECGAPAAVAWSTTAHGSDFGPPNEAIFEIQRVQCAAGHWYTRTVLAAKVDKETFDC